MNVKSFHDLVNLLSLEKLDYCLYRGQNYMTPWGRIFGGQVLAQALMAAYDTVPDTRIAHSLHGYFILTGDVEKPVIYQVDTTRDGGSFTTRRVSAIQNGKTIFIMAVSFQERQEGVEHQYEMPTVKPPEELIPMVEQAESIRETHPIIYRIILSAYQGAVEFRSAR